MTAPGRHRAVAVLVTAAVLGLALAGCGTPSADLFVATRTGEGPGARLTLRVDDGGEVRCNGGAKRQLGSDRLLTARELVRDLEPAARDGVTLPPGPDGVLRYRLRLGAGTVAFGDTSRGLTDPMRRASAFVRQVSKEVCGLAR